MEVRATGRLILDLTAKYSRVIHVRVPLDLNAIADGDASAFALATPLALVQILALAVRQSIGDRAPRDLFERNFERTLAALDSGDITVTVDGRECRRLDEVIVCGTNASVRFFLSHARHSALAALFR